MSLRECLSGPDRLDVIQQQIAERARLGGYDELVQDPPSVLTLQHVTVTLSKIPSDWTGKVLDDHDGADDGAVMADWPGGIGEEPVFGEVG